MFPKHLPNVLRVKSGINTNNTMVGVVSVFFLCLTRDRIYPDLTNTNTNIWIRGNKNTGQVYLSVWYCCRVTALSTVN